MLPSFSHPSPIATDPPPGPFLGALLRIGRTAATVQHLRLRLDGIFAGGAARVGLAPGVVLPEVLPPLDLLESHRFPEFSVS
jgi:hypothetical protein